jgi:integrase-like protein
VLKAVRAQQRGAAQLLGRAWTDTGLVFTRADGSAWHPEYVSRHFADLVRQAGVPVIRLHDLRHTHASTVLASGVHLKVMQERLGHSSISVTADLYSHVTPALQHGAAARIAARALGDWHPALTDGLQEAPGDDAAGLSERTNPQVRGGAPEGIRTPNLLIRRSANAIFRRYPILAAGAR